MSSERNTLEKQIADGMDAATQETNPCFTLQSSDGCDCEYAVSLDGMCHHLNLKGKFAKDSIRKSYNRYADLNNLKRYTLSTKDPTKNEGRRNSAFVSATNMFKYLQSRKCKASLRIVKYIRDQLPHKTDNEKTMVQSTQKLKIHLETKKTSHSTIFEKIKHIESNPEETFLQRCVDATSNKKQTISFFKWLNKMVVSNSRYYSIKRSHECVEDEQIQTKEFIDNTTRLLTLWNNNQHCDLEDKKTQNKNMMIKSANRLRHVVKDHTDVVIINIVFSLLQKDLNLKLVNITRCQGSECANFNISTEEINIFNDVLKSSLVALLPCTKTDDTKYSDTTNIYNHIFGVDARNIHIKKYIFNDVLSLNVQNRNHIQLVCCVMRDVFFYYNKILRKFLNLNINKDFLTWAREHKTVKTDASIRICELRKKHARFSITS